MDVNRRITEKLLRYWLQIRGNRQLPPENDFEQEALGDMWDSCFLVELRKGRYPYKYTYVGKDLIDAFGGNMTNDATARELSSPFITRIQKKFAEVVITCKPVNDEAEFKNANQLSIKYRQVLLPIGNEDGKTIKHILGGMRWKT